MPEQSDQDGKFNIANLIPEVEFDLWVEHVIVVRAKLKPGETKDLGDLVVRKAEWNLTLRPIHAAKFRCNV